MRSFTQDDAHIFCRPDQVKDEFIRVMEIIEIIFNALDFKNFEAQISLRDPKNTTKYVGSDEVWEKAESAIIEACREKGLPAKVEYGEAAFYGPKLDFMVKDAIGRRWTRIHGRGQPKAPSCDDSPCAVRKYGTLCGSAD